MVINSLNFNYKGHSLKIVFILNENTLTKVDKPIRGCCNVYINNTYIDKVTYLASFILASL